MVFIGVSPNATTQAMPPVTGAAAFDVVFAELEPKLRRSLVAAYGTDRGREATAEALAWAWEHRDRLVQMDRPLAYLYRVGQSRTRLKRRRILYQIPESSDPWVEPGLQPALAQLTARQRVTVILAVGYDWTAEEIAELLGIKKTSVHNHHARGLAKLRRILGSDV